MLGEIYNQSKLEECSSWAQSPTTSPEKDKGDGMFCSQCGTEAQPTAKFCQKCGSPFTPFLPTQPNEVAGKTRLLQDNQNIKAAPPVQQAPRPERTTRQASPSRSKSPTLWNPGAAASWSLLFTPVFGAYLHMRNWEELGEPEKAKSSKTWFYISIPLSIFLLGLPCLLAWYFISGKEQMAYVKEKYGDNYNKKSWGAPIMAGIGIFMILQVLGMVGGLFVEKAMQPRRSTANAVQQPNPDLDPNFGKEQSSNGNSIKKTMSYEEAMGISSSPNAVQQQPNPFADPNFGAPDYTHPPAKNPFSDPNFGKELGQSGNGD